MEAVQRQRKFWAKAKPVRMVEKHLPRQGPKQLNSKNGEQNESDS